MQNRILTKTFFYCLACSWEINKDPALSPPYVHLIVFRLLQRSWGKEKGLTEELVTSSTLRRTTEAVHLSQTCFYQVQQSGNYFFPDLWEIRNVGLCNPRFCATDEASRRIHTSVPPGMWCYEEFRLRYWHPCLRQGVCLINRRYFDAFESDGVTIRSFSLIEQVQLYCFMIFSTFIVYYKGAMGDIQFIRLKEKQILLCTELAAWLLE